VIIFLTGAAGLLGGALAHELIRRGHGVIGLVHNQSEIRDNDGAALDAPIFDGALPSGGKARTLRGDITKPDLGIDEASLTALVDSVDCVIHCAAMVRFEAAFEDLKAVNIEGTRNIAAMFPNARFVHVSTAYSCGLREGLIAEKRHGDNDAFGNGYERSKAISEDQLLAMRPDAIIARPSIVLGEHESGRIRSFDSIYAAFKFIASGRIASVPVAPGSTLSFVPIDHVVAGIVALATQAQTPPQIAHHVAREAISSEVFLKLIGQIPGLLSPAITTPGRDASQLSGMTQRLVQPYLSYFTRSPRFEANAITRLTGIEPPDMSEADIIKQIEFCVASGFIKPQTTDKAAD